MRNHIGATKTCQSAKPEGWIISNKTANKMMYAAITSAVKRCESHKRMPGYLLVSNWISIVNYQISYQTNQAKMIVVNATNHNKIRLESRAFFSDVIQWISCNKCLIPAKKWWKNAQASPIRTSFTNHVFNQLMRMMKSASERTKYCKANKINGIDKNKPIPETRCKIETTALMGNFMVNKFRFLGLFVGRFFCIIISLRLPYPSFPRKLESIVKMVKFKMNSRLRGNDGCGVEMFFYLAFFSGFCHRTRNPSQ